MIFSEELQAEWKKFSKYCCGRIWWGAVEGTHFSGQLFFLPAGFASSWPSLLTCQDLLFLFCSWPRPSGPDFIPLITGNSSSSPTQPCKLFPSQKAEEENSLSSSSVINHSRQSHRRAVHHKTTTRHHLENPKLMLRTQWEPLCGVLSAPVSHNQSGSGPQGEKSPFPCCFQRPEEQKPLEEGRVKLSSSTSRWVPRGALLGLPGNLETAAAHFSQQGAFPGKK